MGALERADRSYLYILVGSTYQEQMANTVVAMAPKQLNAGHQFVGGGG